MVKKVKDKWNNTPITVKVSVSYAICSVLQKCLSFITIPIFVRLLSTDEYGQYIVYSSWQGILVIFLTLNLAYGSFQTAMAKFDNRRDEYISSIQGICLLLVGMFIVVYFPFRCLWNQLFELPTIFVFVLVADIFFGTCIQLWMGKNRFEFKYKSVVAITLLNSIASPLVALYLVKNCSSKGYARITGYAGVNIVIGIVIFIINSKRGKKIYNKEFWKYAFGFNIPLLGYYFSQSIFNQSDRIMISHMVGASEAAMYGVAYNLAMILIFIINAINGSYVPWVYEKIKTNKCEENKAVSISLACIVAVVILGVIWYAPEIIMIMAGEKYVGAVYVIAPVAMSLFLLFYSQLFINVEFYFEQKRMLVLGSIGAAILNIILNYWLIPVWGFVVAGYTTFFSYIVFALSNCLTLKHFLRKKNIPDNLYEYKLLLLVFISFVLIGFLGVMLYSIMIIRLIITVVVLIVIGLYRNKILSTLKIIKVR